MTNLEVLEHPESYYLASYPIDEPEVNGGIGKMYQLGDNIFELHFDWDDTLRNPNEQIEPLEVLDSEEL